MNSETTVTEIVAAVKAHAVKHYEENGWDFVVECWTDSEIAQHIRENNITNCTQAINSIRKIVRTLDDVRSDIQATAF